MCGGCNCVSSAICIFHRARLCPSSLPSINRIVHLPSLLLRSLRDVPVCVAVSSKPSTITTNYNTGYVLLQYMLTEPQVEMPILEDCGEEQLSFLPGLQHATNCIGTAAEAMLLLLCGWL
jgi:hypothetical protein